MFIKVYDIKNAYKQYIIKAIITSNLYLTYKAFSSFSSFIVSITDKVFKIIEIKLIEKASI